MNRESVYTKEEVRSYNYNLVTDFARKIDNLKGYEVGYGNPRKGKMIINHEGMNYIIDIELIGHGDLNDKMKSYDYIFED